MESSKLESMLIEHEKVTNKVAVEIIEELKSNSHTYGEINKKLVMLKKQIDFKYDNQQKYEYLFNQVKKMLEEEKNDLLITNRPHS